MRFRFLRKKSVIALIAALVLLSSWIIVSMLDNYSPNLKPAPVIAGEFAGAAICSPSEWSCTFNLSDSTNESWQDVPIEDAYKSRCEQMGGKWKCYGRCDASYQHYCDFAYPDAGAACITSIQCGGRCVGSFGIGTCSEYPLRQCDHFTEIVFGIPISNQAVCG